jgi:Uma2 family endonuclease
MSAVATPPPRPSAATVAHQPLTYGTDPSTYRLTGEQYDRMVEVGILGPDDKLELLDGVLVTKMPNDPPHASSVQRVAKRIRRPLPAGWDDRIQSPILARTSRPEPDIAVVREQADFYATTHPSVADIGLLIEVADSLLVRDLRDKAALYAAAGVPQYWVVNLPDGQVESFADPADGGYTVVEQHAAGDLVPLVLDGATVAHVPAADLLP